VHLVLGWFKLCMRIMGSWKRCLMWFHYSDVPLQASNTFDLLMFAGMIVI
jgi:hypothetical protein